MDPRNSTRRAIWTSISCIALAVALFLLTSGQRERHLLLNTLYLVGCPCVLAVPVGTYLAGLIARTDLPLKKIFGVIVVVALFFPLYTQTAAWQAGFGQQGWSVHWLDGWRGAVWIHTVAAVPWVAVIVSVGLRQIEPQLEEAALLHGTQTRVLWGVTLRRSWFSILAATMWVAVLTAGEFTVTDMWWLRTYAEDIFRGFAVGETPETVAFGLLPSLGATAALLTATLFVLHHALLDEYRTPTRQLWLYTLGPLRWANFVVVAVILFCLVGVPLTNLVIQLGLVVEQLPEGGLKRKWSAGHACEMLLYSVWEFRREVLWSLGTSVVAATGALLVAIAPAWFAQERSWRVWPMIALAAVLFALPGPVMGLCISWLFNWPNWSWLNFLYDRSILAPTIALAFRALPLVMMVVWYALRSVPQKALDAAALDEASRWDQLIWIALPQRLPALGAAWLMGLAIALGDLAASFLVLPPGASPLSRRIFEEVHYGVPDRIAGITLVTMLMTSAIVLAALALLYVSTRGKERSTW